MSEKKVTHSKFAELLDSKFRVPNTDIRFGIDPLLGLIPGVGDWIGGAFSIYFLFYAVLLKAKTAVLLRMFVNILLDVLIGSIPLLGDAFDVFWKTNERNAALLAELRENPERTTGESRSWLWFLFIQFVVAIIGLLLLLGWLIGWLLGVV